jgi:hypothetical protein
VRHRGEGQAACCCRPAPTPSALLSPPPPPPSRAAVKALANMAALIAGFSLAAFMQARGAGPAGRAEGRAP